MDDVPANLILLRGMLGDGGYELLDAASGPEAIEAARTCDPAVILLDAMMPDMDGFETARRLRTEETTRHIPIIFITALGTEDKHVFQGYETGAVDYLIKPLEPEVLRSKVRIFADLHQRKHELKAAAQELEKTVKALESARDNLKESEKRYRTLLDIVPHCILEVDRAGSVIFANRAGEAMLGLSGKALADRPLIELAAEEPGRESLRLHLERLRQNNAEARLWTGKLRSDAGTTFDVETSWQCRTDEHGNPAGSICVATDITDRLQMEAKLRFEAFHDPLTGLANRALCLDRINRALIRSKRRENYYFAVVFMDLDRFKVINDSLGHAFGDQILIQTGQRLEDYVRRLDTVARFGGDEFVVILEEMISPSQAIRIIKRVREALKLPIAVGDHEIQISASFGLALAPFKDKTAEDLLQHANIAMHRSKERGRDRIQVFNSKMLERAIHTLTLENDLRRALAEEEFSLAFQPIVSLETGRLAGFEALCRWTCPRRGPVSPAEFIPAAEETGMILELGEWVLKQACATLAEWRKARPEAQGLHVAVNVSARQFSRPDMVDTILDTLNKTGLPHQCLKIEVTESAIMDNPDNAAGKLLRLKRAGIMISVDDFGTGYSSMSHLQRFPLDVLKIDLSFVRGMEEAHGNRDIVKAIVDLAHNLGLEVVAEGVENHEQRTLLKEMNCEFGQGYLFARPLTPPDALNFLSI